MATNDSDKILINVGLNAEEAEAGITALGQKINAVSKQDLGTTNVQSYRLAIRQLTQELQKIEQVQGRNSQAFRDGAKELGRLKLAATDFKETIEAYDPSNKFKGIANIAKGAAVGMTGAAGAMALFGIKGEKAEEVMLRLQGILALSHAISSIHEITTGYKAFINVLGLTTTAAKKVDGITLPSAPGSTGAATTDASAEAERVSTAQVAYDEASTEAEEALTAAKAEGLDATVALTGAEEAYLETARAKAAALAELTEAQIQYDAAVAAGTTSSVQASEANLEQAATTGAVAVAEEGATGAAIGLKVALWSIGIGLLITAIAYLIANWDKVKTSIENMFPALKNAGSAFSTFSQIASGVGLAILKFIKAPIDEAISGFKIFIDLIRLDFKGAAKDFQDGVKQMASDMNVIANFREGAAEKAAQLAEAERKIRVQKEIDANTRIIAERKALGKDVFALEVKNQQLKNSVLDKDDKDYQKSLLDGESQVTVFQNEEIKKRTDAAEKIRKEAAEKAAAAKKADLDKLKSGEDEAAKVLYEGRASARDIELSDAQFKYDKLLAIANKYGQDSSKLTEALGITKSRINKKYDDEAYAYLSKLDEESLNDFDKKRVQIERESVAASKNASDELKALIERDKAYQLAVVAQEEKLSNASEKAKTGVTVAEDKNRAKVAPEGKGDTPQETFNKEEAIRKAKLIALKADYLQQQFLAKGNADKLAELNANYNKEAKDSDDEGAKARIALAQAERDAKLATYQAVSDALADASDIAGKNTVAGKALAVASATISTYVSAQKAYESMADIPIIGPELGIVAAAAAVAMGLKNVKSILSVKVPGASSSAAGQTPSYQAPTINSTVLNQAQQGVQNVNVLNQPEPTKQQPVKAYVVEKDITNAQDRAAYLNRRSTI